MAWWIIVDKIYKSFDEWLPAVTFGKDELYKLFRQNYKKYMSYMRLSFDARQPEIDQLKKENDQLKQEIAILKNRLIDYGNA